MKYNIIAEHAESTVVAEYTPSEYRSDFYQSEADLERDFIKGLQSQGYEYLEIHNETDLVSNLRAQLEILNDYRFSDSEWKHFFRENLANANEGIEEKTRRIQEECRVILKKDDGTAKNITLIDRQHVYNNRLQVINQYEENKGTYKNRYDVTILVNGFPMVHIELKRRGVAIREAFNQIKRYQRDSFWAGCGLYEYVQIFVISNGTHTKYYSNTTREAHIRENEESGRKKSKKTSNSFEFTSFWADGNNNQIADLTDFTKTFFCSHTLLNILTRFCVFTSENMLLVMRPYQITATERILQRIEIANNYHTMGTTDAGGYIWHTTGSGKTLTSFKTAQLATQLPYIDKVLFVVDRQDLDYQTMKEYDRFQKGAANGNSNTKVLTRQLEDNSSKIIITTIQKLGRYVHKELKSQAEIEKRKEVYNKHFVIIFDECHRSQFGDLHKDITKAFKNYHMFGFTGTPIFPENAIISSKTAAKTTDDAFGDRLHIYTIVNAINDGNVLPFKIDYVNTLKMGENVVDYRVEGIDVEKALNAPERVSIIVKYILDHFEQKTKRNSFYSLKGQRVAGFNSIFAVSSIVMAKKYYYEFKKQMIELNKNLTVATIFSYAPNEDDVEDTIVDVSFSSDDLDKLDKNSRDFLSEAISDYNNIFKTNFDTSSDNFQNYYKDLSLKMKQRQVDLLIVVNMFLTGFDATTLNTLWVDKTLKYHGLIQAFSRTNRILNSVKTFGNIVCFRDLQEATEKALARYGDANAGGIVLLRKFDDYYNGYYEEKNDGSKKHNIGYVDLINELLTVYPLGQQIIGEQNEKDFIALYGTILRMRNILTSFDEFENKDIITEWQLQDYQSIYIDLRDKYSKEHGQKENINNDIIFETELIRQVEVNIDYILMLVEMYQKSNRSNKEILVKISKAINSSIELRSKKELIEGFIAKVNVSSSVSDEWKAYVTKRREEDLSALIESEKLKPELARQFIDKAFKDGELKTRGTEIQNILPPSSPFDKKSSQKKKGIIEKIKEFFEKYIGLVI